MIKRVRAHHLLEMKREGTPITMLTAYDSLTSQIFDAAGIDTLLVGDSIGNTMLGYGSTIPVTMEEMLVATRSVVRGAQRAFVVADLPMGSYEESPEQGVRNAIRLIKVGASAVKLEGGVRMAKTIRAIVDAGVPVVGHIGFTPQSENALGGPRVQGRGDSAADKVLADAVAVEEAGATAVVLEMVPERVSAKITQVLNIPTIGIGAGVHCDGQVLVWTDMAGMTDWNPSFAKRFGELGAALKGAAEAYNNEVKARIFPDENTSFQK